MPSTRLILIFIIGTFRDFMGNEVKSVMRVFPELRLRFNARFVELLEVDLRWGITEVQSRATLKICLQWDALLYAWLIPALKMSAN